MKPCVRSIHILLLVLLTGLAYCRVTDNGFIGGYDDAQYVTENVHVQQGLTLNGLRWASTTTYSGNWHPLTWISHMLDWQLYGSKAAGHHLTSLFFHLANTVLLFLLLCWTSGRTTRSLFVAALFAVHPLHVESVAWVAERKDVLSTFFCFITIAAYLHYLRRPMARRYALVMLAFVLGLMCKPMLVSLPIALLLLDYWPLGRLSMEDGCFGRLSNPKRPPRAQNSLRMLIIEKLPLFALSAASCAITVWAQGRGGAVESLGSYSFGVRSANAAVAAVNYLAKMLWPRDLAIFYPHPERTLPVWVVIGSILILCLGVAAAIRCARAKPFVTMGLLWYAITLLPIVGLVQVGMQGMADRYTYVPLIGPFILIAWSIPDAALKKPYGRTLWSAAATLLIVGLAARTFVEVGYWRGTESIFRRAIAVTRGNGVAYYDLAVEMQKQKRWREAERYNEEVLKIAPQRYAMRNLGIVLLNEREFSKARAVFRVLLKSQRDRNQALVGIAASYMGEGRPADAIPYLERAAEASPQDWRFPYDLGNAYMLLRKPADAAEQYRRAISLQPANPGLYSALAAALFAQGDYAGSRLALDDETRAGGRPDPQLVRRLQRL